MSNSSLVKLKQNVGFAPDDAQLGVRAHHFLHRERSLEDAARVLQVTRAADAHHRRPRRGEQAAGTGAFDTG
jgi:hypothetical protein